jgi:hypothetical protein
MSSETIDQYVERMQKEIRTFYTQHAAEFRECIREYERWAEAPARGPGRPRVPELVLVALLAEWEAAKAAKVRKPDFLEWAAKGWKWETRSRSGMFDNEDTIAGHIKAAQKLAREKPGFRQRVDEWRWVISVLGGPTRYKFTGVPYKD